MIQSYFIDGLNKMIFHGLYSRKLFNIEKDFIVSCNENPASDLHSLC